MIVNGEAAMRAQLQRLGAERPEPDAVADAASGAQALEIIRALDPDVTVVARVPDPTSPQLIGERSGRIDFLDPHEVDYVASAGNYVAAHVGVNEFLTRATLKNMATRLAPLGFVQIERSLLVNLRRVAYVERHDRGQFCFVMRGGARLLSSRERSPDLRALFLRATAP
jgi:DNA-binding LytR/AlgR family response regulator